MEKVYFQAPNQASDNPFYARSVNSTVTPADMSRELHRDQKTIRAYLRRKYGKLPPLDSRRNLTNEQADDVRRYFRSV